MKLLPALPCAALLLAAAPLFAADAVISADPALTQLALDNLHAVVAHDHDLPRLHAAENLAILGEPDPFAAIKADVPKMVTQPVFRIVTWRVQARVAAHAGASMKAQTDQVVAVFFMQPDASDRVNAAETLGKLRYNPPAAEAARFREVAETAKNPLLRMHARWVLAGNGKKAEEAALAAFLGDPDANVRGDAAYALRFRPHLHSETRKLLIAAAEKEAKGSYARCYLYTSATLHAKKAERAPLLSEVEKYAASGNAEEKYESMNGLALYGTADEIPMLRKYLAPAVPYVEADADIRVAAAAAILNIQRR